MHIHAVPAVVDILLTITIAVFSVVQHNTSTGLQNNAHLAQEIHILPQELKLAQLAQKTALNAPIIHRQMQLVV